MKKFLLAVKAWIVAHKVIAIVIAGAAALAITTAIVVPVSVSAAKKKKAAQHDSQQPSGDQGGGSGESAKTYTITWKDENGSVLETDANVAHGTVPTFDGKLPSKASSDSEDFAFSSWSPAVVAASADATYTATYSSSARKYAITWVDGNGDTIKTEQVAYGQVPVYTGDDPVKDPTTEEQFEWNHGWDVTPVAVTGPATYTATFDGSPRMYTITWVDGNGNTLKTEQVGYGSTPSYTGDTPTKETTMANTYTFNGTWTPAVQAVSGNATYTANFDVNGHSYHVTFVNYNGDLLQDSGNVAYSDLDDLDYTGDTPTKPQDDQYTYAWNTEDKWSQNIDVENSTVTYTANFTHTTRTYTVTWKDGNGNVIHTSYDVPYGTTPVYDGPTPTKNQTATIHYSFNDTWTPALGNITGNTEYVANFEEGPALYEARFLNTDSSIVETFNDVAYNDPNAINLYEGTPVCPDDSNLNFEFDGWVEEDPDTVNFRRYFRATYHAVSTKPEALSYAFDTDHYVITGFAHHSSKLLTIPAVYNDGENGEHPVTIIGDNAFGWCSDLERLTIPASVTYIGDFTFGGNSNLETVEIAGNPTFGSYAFSQCSKLDTLTVAGNGEYEIKDNAFKECKFSHLTLGPGCTKIGYNAFVGCKFTSFPVLNNVTEIEYRAFQDCNQLTEFTFGSSLETIGYCAFAGCSGLTSIEIPDSVTNMNHGAIFENCGPITSFKIGRGIDDYYNWFNGTTRVGEFVVDEDHTAFSTIDGVLFSKDKSTLIAFPSGRSGEYSIPNDTTDIVSYAFADADALTVINVNEGITSLPSGVFSYCGANTINLPDSLESIGGYAFQYCSVKTLNIGGSVDYIDSSAFYECADLETLTIDPLNTYYVADGLIIYSKDMTKLILSVPSNDLDSFEVPASVNNVYPDAFNGTKIGHVSVGTLGTGAFTLGSSAFANATSEEITIGDRVTVLPSSVFKNATTVTFNLTDNIESIKQNAFENTDIESFVMPASCTELDYSSFYDCESLASFTFNSQPSIEIDSYAFYNTGFVTMTLPANVTSIGNGAFGGCRNLTSFDMSALGAGVTAVPGFFLTSCYNLVSVSLSNYITEINQNAFAQDRELLTIALPSALEEIGQYAFSGCSKLADVTFPVSLTTIGAYAFSGVAVVTFEYAGTGSQWAAFKACRDENWTTWPSAENEKFVMTADDFNYDLYDVAYR